ncbi:MAG: hypothetical protein JWM99_3729 [Verrucomicrobiales bacterium]|nr:hypothetical protein [Verrucomicrobiales bacterium]
MHFLFRFGHPSLFIPWTAIHNAQEKKVLWGRYVRFRVGEPPTATLSMSKKVFEKAPDHILKAVSWLPA